jgi:hypothetical protein
VGIRWALLHSRVTRWVFVFDGLKVGELVGMTSSGVEVGDSEGLKRKCTFCLKEHAIKSARWWDKWWALLRS